LEYEQLGDGLTINEKYALQLRHSDAINIADTSASKNLFGTIAKQVFQVATTMGFIPRDGQGGIIDYTQGHEAQWCGLQTAQMQYWAYTFCSPLAAVIDRLAEADANGVINFVDDKGDIVKNPNKIPVLKRLTTLFSNPNPLMTWEEFDANVTIFSKIFGFCPVFCITPSTFDRTYTQAMFPINPFFCRPQANTDYNMFDKNSRPIKEWIITIFGKTLTIPDEDILLIKDGLIDNTMPNMGIPISKVAGLDFAISNICAAMEADNVLLKKKGPLGIFSFDPKPDVGGWKQMQNPDKKELQAELSNYGMTLGQLQYIISRNPLKWNPMSFNVRDLMTKETARQGIDMICDRLGYPAELMSGKNATYENRQTAERYLYESNIIPYSLRKMARYNQYLGINNTGYRITLCYTHLAVLQDDILKSSQARAEKSKGLEIDWKNGIISYNEYRKGISLEPVEAGDEMYYPQWFERYGKIITPIKADKKPKKDAKAD
jgi:hypothetical protein